MCNNNRCNGNCNRCEVVCDPCKKQPKIYYCGADIACVGVTKGEEISRAIKKIGDKLCQTVNQQNPLTYVNITDATEEQCETGGFVVQILQVGSDNLVSEHILCNGGDFVTTENIVCGTDIVVEEGFGTQSALENITRYFCERVNTEPTILEDIVCGEDVVVEEGALVEEAITNVVEYFCERVGNCIPIPGTDVGNPVTGIIEFNADPSKTFASTVDSKILIGAGNDKDVDEAAIRRSYVSLSSESDLSQAGLRSQDGGNGLDCQIFTTVNSVTGEVELSLTIMNPLNNSAGFTASNYFGANYDDNTYVQKKYVDTAVVALDYGDIILAGGIENVQVYTTGAGTGIASVDLSPIMAIGKDVTVSDLGNNASTHNIQIDSGVGNTILYGGVASQDITLNTNGASVTLRKMTATQWMAI